MPEDKHLATIMFTDTVRYMALKGKDSDKILDFVRQSKEIQKPQIQKYCGTWIKEIRAINISTIPLNILTHKIIFKPKL
jgi:hypothetical protein